MFGLPDFQQPLQVVLRTMSGVELGMYQSDLGCASASENGQQAR
jgi:hypothetical protein